MGDENTDKAWVVSELIEQMLKTTEVILELSKDMHGPIKHCPIVISKRGHRDTSKMLTGREMWKWYCPFCGQEFQH